MNESFYDLGRSLGFLTITANRLMSAYFRKRLIEAGIDLTSEQWGVLAHLWNEGGVAQDELAELVCVNKSSLSRVLDVMERRGLVRRERVPGDARRKILHATAAAEHLKKPCKAVVDKSLRAMLQDCQAAEVEICLKVLAQVKTTIKKLSV